MQDLLDNIYGDTCRKIIEDLMFQYNSATTKKEKQKFIALLEAPIKTYNEHCHGNFVLPKLEEE